MKAAPLLLVTAIAINAGCASSFSYTGHLVRAMRQYAKAVAEDMEKQKMPYLSIRDQFTHQVEASLAGLLAFKKVIDNGHIPGSAQQAHSELQRTTNELIAAREKALTVLHSPNNARPEIREMLACHLAWIRALRAAQDKATFKQKEKEQMDAIIASMEAQIAAAMKEFDLEDEKDFMNTVEESRENAMAGERQRQERLDQMKREEEEKAWQEQEHLRIEEAKLQEEARRQEEARLEEEAQRKREESTQTPPPDTSGQGAPPPDAAGN